METQKSLTDLYALIAYLRSPQGCNWDKAQTMESSRSALVEECYEVLAAIDELSDNPSEKNITHLCEELGDLLLQILFHAQIQKEHNRFSMDTICHRLYEKLIRRHPHLFSNEKNEIQGTSNPYWEKVKKQEKMQAGEIHSNALDDIPKTLPALLKAQAFHKKAIQAGFAVPKSQEEGLKQLDEEMSQLSEMLHNSSAAQREHRLGLIFFTLVQISHQAGVSAEIALEKTLAQFAKEFRIAEGKQRIKK